MKKIGGRPPCRDVTRPDRPPEVTTLSILVLCLSISLLRTSSFVRSVRTSYAINPALMNPHHYIPAYSEPVQTNYDSIALIATLILMYTIIALSDYPPASSEWKVG